MHNPADALENIDGHAGQGGRSHGQVWVDARDMHLEVTAAKPDRLVIGSANFSKEVMAYDPTTQENGFASFPVPNDYKEGGEIIVVCTANATANAALLGGTIAAVGRGAQADAAGTAFANVLKTVPATARLYFDITLALPAAVVPKPGQNLKVKISRIAADGTDTLAVDLEVHGFLFRYRRA